MSIFQHPHTITLQTSEELTEPYQDQNGDWVVPEPGDLKTVNQECRAEANSQDNKVSTKDGTKIDFSFMVYLPKDCVEFNYGQKVTIKDNLSNEVIGEADVKRFFRGQMNCRLWV